MALAHAILVSLSDCPCSGYDLAKRFDGSVGFFWDASHQQIYRELSKLEDEGYLTAEKVVQESRPNKKVYSVTDLGRSMLTNWIAEPSSICPIKDDLLVKLFGGYLVPRSVMIQELEHHQHQHQQRLNEYEMIQKTFFAEPEHLAEVHLFQYLTLRNGIQFESAWLAWCDEALKMLGS